MSGDPDRDIYERLVKLETEIRIWKWLIRALATASALGFGPQVIQFFSNGGLP